MHRISRTPLLLPLLLPNKDQTNQLKKPRKDNKQRGTRGSCPFFLLFSHSISLSVTQVKLNNAIPS